jgi:hypothetical protein
MCRVARSGPSSGCSGPVDPPPPGAAGAGRPRRDPAAAHGQQLQVAPRRLRRPRGLPYFSRRPIEGKIKDIIYPLRARGEGHPQGCGDARHKDRE